MSLAHVERIAQKNRGYHLRCVEVFVPEESVVAFGKMGFTETVSAGMQIKKMNYQILY